MQRYLQRHVHQITPGPVSAVGMNSYIQKPVDFDNFSEVVSDLGDHWLMLNKLPV